MIKRILKIFFGMILLIVICSYGIKTKINSTKHNIQKENFIKNATLYLEQKYNISISECTYYKEKRVEYTQPLIDDGYFYSTPEFGVFCTNAGTEIKCVNKDGIYSDDYELSELYSLIYQNLSNQLNLNVQYVKFNSNSEEIFSTDNGNYSIPKNIGMYLEKDIKRYDENTISDFLENLYQYLENTDLEIYIKVENELNRDDFEQITKNIKNYKEKNSLNSLNLYIYNQNIQTHRIPIQNTIDDGAIYNLYLDSDYLYSYLYELIKSNNENELNGYRIIENKR